MIPPCVEICIRGFKASQIELLESNKFAVEVIAKKAFEARLQGQIHVSVGENEKGNLCWYSITHSKHFFCFGDMYEILSEMKKLSDFEHLQIYDLSWTARENSRCSDTDEEDRYVTCFIEVALPDEEDVLEALTTNPEELLRGLEYC